jgi:hypothetical protein
MNNVRPADSLLDTLRLTGLPETLAAITEVSLDTALTDGLLRDLPIFGTVLALGKTGLAIRDYLFFQKTLRFLHPVSEISSEDRRKFLASLSPDDLRRASQHAVMHIDRLDSNGKAEWLGRAYAAYMRGRINFRELQYFAHYLDRVLILVWQDFHAAIANWAATNAGAPRIHAEDALALEAAGVYERELTVRRRMDVAPNAIVLSGVQSRLVLTDGGWRFIQVVLGIFEDNEDARSWLAVDLHTAVR